jgi:hypothetical protein
MKFTKLSLAAIIAVGALGSFASAAPIEEAIKGVDVSGLVRYRYEYNNNDVSATRTNRYSAQLNVVSPVADSLTAGVSVRAETGQQSEAAAAESYNTAASVTGIEKAWFKFAADGLSAQVGKFEIPTPWTESGYNGDRGNGLLALYSGVPGWTFGAAFYNNIFLENTLDTFGGNNLYALTAIGAVGPVNLQVWLSKWNDVFDYAAYAEAVLKLDGIYAKGQVNYLKLDKAILDESGLFFGLEGGYDGKVDDLGVKAIIGVTVNDDKQGTFALDTDNDGFIKFGQQLYERTANSPDTKVFFAKAGVTVDKLGAELGYGLGKDVGSDDVSEILALLNYKYAKNFGLQLYYSYLDWDEADAKNTEIRFQAQYNF